LTNKIGKVRIGSTEQEEGVADGPKTNLTLTDEAKQVLIEHRDHDERPYVRERCAALLKIAEGKSSHWVAHHGLLKRRGPDTVYKLAEYL
jgi:hypothetical protein